MDPLSSSSTTIPAGLVTPENVDNTSTVWSRTSQVALSLFPDVAELRAEFKTYSKCKGQEIIDLNSSTLSKALKFTSNPPLPDVKATIHAIIRRQIPATLIVNYAERIAVPNLEALQRSAYLDVKKHQIPILVTTLNGLESLIKNIQDQNTDPQYYFGLLIVDEDEQHPFDAIPLLCNFTRNQDEIIKEFVLMGSTPIGKNAFYQTVLTKIRTLGKEENIFYTDSHREKYAQTRRTSARLILKHALLDLQLKGNACSLRDILADHLTDNKLTCLPIEWNYHEEGTFQTEGRKPLPKKMINDKVMQIWQFRKLNTITQPAYCTISTKRKGLKGFRRRRGNYDYKFQVLVPRFESNMLQGWRDLAKQEKMAGGFVPQIEGWPAIALTYAEFCKQHQKNKCFTENPGFQLNFH